MFGDGGRLLRKRYTKPLTEVGAANGKRVAASGSHTFEKAFDFPRPSSPTRQRSTAAAQTEPWLLSGSEYRGRHRSKAIENPGRRNERCSVPMNSLPRLGVERCGRFAASQWARWR